MNESRPARNCWYLTGATAVGKTEVGLVLARRLQAEIISLDSMAIYRGMDIGTAKPSAEQQSLVPHHLIDIAEPEEEFSIDRYLEAAHAKIAEINARGHRVLFVGGTPLYLKALLRGMSSGPPADWKLREAIEKEAAQLGADALYKRVEQIDPIAASQIHPHDTRRLIRALEVFRSTGEPISHQQLHFEDAIPAEECKVFVLRRPREEQHRLINERVDEMPARGLVEEVKQFIEAGRHYGRTASQAVGYREVLQYLEDGDFAAMVERMKTRTRRFAKRQGTWFRSLSECRFMDIAGTVDADAVAEQIEAEAS